MLVPELDQRKSAIDPKQSLLITESGRLAPALSCARWRHQRAVGWNDLLGLLSPAALPQERQFFR